jgi:hypothetical protein
MARLFRSMKEGAGGVPQVEASARALGVRPGIDVPAAHDGETVQPGQGGVSVSPDDPLNLPYFRRPPEFQGTGKDPVWTIDETQLGPDLRYRPDAAHPGHGFIEPVRPMKLGEYRKAVEQTQSRWQKVQPPPDKGDDSDAD